MDQHIVSGAIGQVGKYNVDFKGQDLVIEVLANSELVSAGVTVRVHASQVKDAIKKAIPGQIDDAILDIAFAAFTGPKTEAASATPAAPEVPKA